MDDEFDIDDLNRQSEEIWRRIDLIMITIKKEYIEEEESDEKIESLLPTEDGGAKKRSFFLKDGDSDSENSTSYDIDFAQSALSNYGQYEQTETASRNQTFLRGSSSRSLREKEDVAIKNRPKVNIDDLQAKVAANEEAVDKLYGAGKTEGEKESMFTMNMSVDPIESSLDALGRFGEFDSPGHDDDKAFQQKLRL